MCCVNQDLKLACISECNVGHNSNHVTLLNYGGNSIIAITEQN